MKKSIITLIVAMLALSACGQKGDKGDTGAPGQDAPIVVTPPPPADPIQDEIDELISQKNEDRAILAQAPLTNGLSCVVQQVASGQCLSTSSPGCSGLGVVMTGPSYTYLYKGSFTQPDSAGSDPILLLPTALRSTFAGKNFRIVCTGQIVVLDSGYYDFSLNSDDGSILTINGSQVVNNDANHGMTLKTGSALLYRGVQSFSLQYAQTGSGNFGLVLQSGGASIDPRYYFH